MTAATIIFLLTYAALAVGRVPRLHMDRAGIAFVGAAAVLALGVLPLREALAPESVDYPTLLLLLAMMIVAAVLHVAGFFEHLAGAVLAHVQTPRGLLACTVMLGGLLSAFLVNDVVCLALTPVVIQLAARLRCDPVPHLIALATAANIGSASTITGNPQNMMIGVQSGIAYGHFAARLMPVSLVGLLIDFALIALIFRGALRSPPPLPPEPPTSAPKRVRRLHRLPRRRLRAKAILVTLAAVVLFFCGFPVPVVAAGAAAVLLLDRIRPEKIYRLVDWSLLLMFFGLFVVVHAFNVRVVSHWGIENWHAVLDRPVDLLAAASAALSNLVSNVPAVMLLEPLVRHMPATSRPTAWLTLAMSSTFAGNLTILGSVANLIVAETARRHGVKLSLRQYCKVGVPLTLITLALGVGWLMI